MADEMNQTLKNDGRLSISVKTFQLEDRKAFVSYGDLNPPQSGRM